MAAPCPITAPWRNGKMPMDLNARDFVTRRVCKMICGVTTESMPMVAGWVVGVCTIPTVPKNVPQQQDNAQKWYLQNAQRENMPAGEEWMKMSAHFQTIAFPRRMNWRMVLNAGIIARCRAVLLTCGATV